MLSSYGKREWRSILLIGLILTATSLIGGLWWLALAWATITAALLSFFRDPNRSVPTQRGAVVCPADGRISSIHTLDHFDPLDGPATCIRIFMSILDVHVNRSPCHATIKSIAHRPGNHLSVLNPRSVEENESNLLLLVHPTTHQRLAAVRQIAGRLARTIVCGVDEHDILQRGQRFGMIKFGSTVELYLPANMHPDIQVKKGRYVYGGITIAALVESPQRFDTSQNLPATGGAQSSAATTRTAP